MTTVSANLLTDSLTLRWTKKYQLVDTVTSAVTSGGDTVETVVVEQGANFSADQGALSDVDAEAALTTAMCVAPYDPTSCAVTKKVAATKRRALQSSSTFEFLAVIADPDYKVRIPPLTPTTVPGMSAIGNATLRRAVGRRQRLGAIAVGVPWVCRGCAVGVLFLARVFATDAADAAARAPFAAVAAIAAADAAAVPRVAAAQARRPHGRPALALCARGRGRLPRRGWVRSSVE